MRWIGEFRCAVVWDFMWILTRQLTFRFSRLGKIGTNNGIFSRCANKRPLFSDMIAHTVGAQIGAPFLTNWILSILHTVPMKTLLSIQK